MRSQILNENLLTRVPAMYQALAADNTNVTFADAGLALPNVTGPNDGAHPSPTGAKRTAEWLMDQINSL